MDTTKKLYWHFAASCCLVLFVILGYIAKFYEATLTVIDQPISQLIRQNMTANKSLFYLTITRIGDATTIAFLVVVVSFIFWQKKWHIEALWLLINSGLIAGLGNFLIKFAFARQRPLLEQLINETHYSFPSGHAMASLLFFGTLIMLLPNIIKHKPFRLCCQAVLGILILLIGISRIYVGVHYPTDIIGGYLLGAAWLLGSYPTFQKQRFIWRFKGKQN